MQITRRGYYTITGPDGQLLQSDGSTRQATSRDSCYEYITEDGRGGTFTIHCPNRDVDVGDTVAAPIPEPTPSVLWDTSINGFTSTRNEPGESATSVFNDPDVGSVHRMDYIGGGQNYFGGYIYESAVRDAIADSRQLNVRYLIKFGDALGQNEWARGNDVVLGDVWGFELKAFDIHNGNISERLIMMIRNAYGNSGDVTDKGQIVLRIDGTGGEREVYVPENSDGYRVIFDGSGIWYYLEIQVSDDGSVKHWYTPYTGAGDEYVESSPTVDQANAQTYDFDWIRTANFDFGFRNHASAAGTNTIYSRLTISNSFIGPRG